MPRPRAGGRACLPVFRDGLCICCVGRVGECEKYGTCSETCEAISERSRTPQPLYTHTTHASTGKTMAAARGGGGAGGGTRMEAPPRPMPAALVSGPTPAAQQEEEETCFFLVSLAAATSSTTTTTTSSSSSSNRSMKASLSLLPASPDFMAFQGFVSVGVGASRRRERKGKREEART